MHAEDAYEADWGAAAERFTELAAAIDRYAHVAADLIMTDQPEASARAEFQRNLATELWCDTIDVAHWYEQRQEQE